MAVKLSQTSARGQDREPTNPGYRDRRAKRPSSSLGTQHAQRHTMNLVGACVLLVADDLGTLDRMRRYLARAGAQIQAASRAPGLSAAASHCDAVVLFDDYRERDEFDACRATLSESKVPFLIVSDRPHPEASAPGAGLLVASARSVAPSSFLDALRAQVPKATMRGRVDSVPELPFTD